MDVDGRQIISPEAERDWRLERERETAEAARRLAPHAANPTEDEEAQRRKVNDEERSDDVDDDVARPQTRHPRTVGGRNGALVIRQR